MYLKLLAKKSLKPLSCALVTAALVFSQAAWSYVKFSNKPTEAWDDLFVQSGADKYYTVQRGDTLYDISRTLFGDPDFWPKIWSLNSKITNPHIIEKGQIIYFVGGTGYLAPLLGMSTLQPESYTYGNHFLTPEIPPPNVTRGPIEIPKSLPNLLRAAEENESEVIKELYISKRAAREAVRSIEITSEITKSSPVSVGKIKRVFNGARYAVIGDLVYLKVFSGVNVGDELSIYKLRTNWLPLRRLLPLRANLVEWLGKVKIKSTAENGYVAEVTQANSIIQIDENLAVRELKKVEIPIAVSQSVLKASINANTKIIGAHKVAGTEVVGENQIVYLNSGASAGVEEGEIYPLYTNFGSSGLAKNKEFVPKRIGYIKIASVENSVSTGVAFNLISEVQVDQTVGL